MTRGEIQGVGTRVVVLGIIARGRATAGEVRAVMVRMGIPISLTRVHQHLRRLEERDGLAVSERVKTGRAGNRRREYWAV